MSIVQLKVDYSKCIDPLVCHKCMEVCPASVFVCGPSMVWKFKETDTKEFKLIVRYIEACSGCGDCIKVCESQALELSYITKEEYRVKIGRKEG